MADALLAEHQRQYAAVRAFLEAAALGDRDAYLASLETLNWPTAWHEVFRGVVALGHVHPDTRLVFAEQWVGLDDTIPLRAPNGSKLPRMFAGALDLFVDGLRILLPSLEGEAPKVVYRGQSVSAYEKGIIGFCWSTIPMQAECYARMSGMNSEPCIVLAQFLPGEEIIGYASPTELILDPRLVRKPHVIEVPRSKIKHRETMDGSLPLFSQCETLAFHNLFELRPLS